MRLDTCLFGIVLVVVAGCTTVVPGSTASPSQDTVRLSGMVTDRREVAAALGYVAHEGAILGTTGLAGLFIAQLAHSTPKHYVYTVESANGTEYSVPAKTDIAVGTCLAFLVPKSKADQFFWQLDDIGIEPNSSCLTATDSAYDATADQQLDANGNNALHIAIWHGQTKRALRIIEQKSVDLNSVNRFGATALHLAVTKENAKIVQTLIDAGANPNIRNNNGATPVVDATEKGSREILDLLKKAGAS